MTARTQDRAGAPSVSPRAASLLSGLQVGRGIAALAVVAFHLSTAMGDARYGGQTVFASITWRGNLGVDYFFVLSGFIILHAHAADLGAPGRWLRYVHRRFVRLYPIYWIYTLVISFLILAGFATVAKVPPTPAGWVSSLTLIRFSTDMPPLRVAWTLFHEMAFYVLFSIAILNKRLGVVVLGAWALICLVAYQYPDTSHPTPLAVYTAAYNLNFFLGMAALWLYRKDRFAGPMLAAGALEFAGALGLEYAGFAVPPLVYAMSFALMVAGTSILERRGKLSFPWLARRLGDASYTIYLIHVPVVGLLLKIAMMASAANLIGRQALYVTVLALTAAIGMVAYTWVERPLLTRLRGHSAPRPPLTPPVPAAAQD